MILLVGLGNIGKEYEKTRHNFGFLAIDEIVKSFNFQGPNEKFSSDFFQGEISSKKIIAIKPKTYMNLSGIAVLQALSFYKIMPENIIVFHDDLDIKFGEIRIKQGGGNAGHNGLKSIDEKIGANYHRFRLGINRPENKEYEVSDFVLSNFSTEQFQEIPKITQKILEILPDFIQNKIA